MNTTETMITLSDQTPKTPRKDRTEDGLALPQSFTAHDIQRLLGLTSGGAASQVRRWIVWGWVENTGGSPSVYRRTASFGGVKVARTTAARGKKTGANVVTCDICQYHVWGKDGSSAQRALARHQTMKHGMKKQYIPAALRQQLGYGPNTKYGIIPTGNKNGTPAPAPAPAPPAPEYHLRFCPECGFNIEMHNMSYRIARKHRKD